MNEECCNHNCNQGRDCPLRKKELKDEEIIEVFYGLEIGHSIQEFARAILRKAQEK